MCKHTWPIKLILNLCLILQASVFFFLAAHAILLNTLHQKNDIMPTLTGGTTKTAQINELNINDRFAQKYLIYSEYIANQLYFDPRHNKTSDGLE